MKRVNFFLAGILLAGILFSSCTDPNSPSSSSGLYVPTSANVTSTASLADLQQGRTLYLNNCGQCHNLYTPDTYSVASWKSIVPNMGGRTAMTQAQINLVLKYVTKGQ